jgi:hypothetical protein
MKSQPSRKVKLRPCGWDALVVAAVVLAALLTLGWTAGRAGDGALVCVVSVNGSEYGRWPLDRVGDSGETVTVGDGAYTVTLRITRDAVWAESATCPNQDCVHTGRITKAGQSIVCLPSRVAAELTSSDGSADFDAVTG